MESMGTRMKFDMNFYRNKRVFVTGHTGFKGTWICRMLINAGAIVFGYSLSPSTNPNLFSISNNSQRMTSVIGDIRDYDQLQKAFRQAEPEIVIHLAAQPIVRESYINPRDTYEINIMGTVNLLECIRKYDGVKSFLNVTTDKVYKNNEWYWGYREDDPLDGFDPYSNSKSCSELVTHSYKNSFFRNKRVAISTARAGNVIGGGDFSKDRIIPDCIQAALYKDNIIVRNPFSVRPYQHVLEPAYVYLLIAAFQYIDEGYADYYNIGPNVEDCITTSELVNLFCKHWGNGLTWKIGIQQDAPHEASLLKLDCNKLRSRMNWKPSWNIDQAVKLTCEFNKIWLDSGDIDACMNHQIEEFLHTKMDI